MAVASERLNSAFREFFDSEKASGVLLIISTIISLIVANSALGPHYLGFWHHPFAGLSVELWVNDGLMAIFFLLIGLELVRELNDGELSDLKSAMLPIIAALGGIIVPASIHFYFNAGTPTQSGIGIPMATDIAFALGMLALAGNRVPYSLKIFLTALAIIDDLGAILVIAIFYSTGMQWMYLAISAAILGALYLLSRLKVYNLAFYLVPGVVLWYCMMQSGVHPTIAGVLLAFVIPFSGDNESTPSYKLQQFLHKPVAFFIVPLFALANTGILLKEGWLSEMRTTNSLGIITGLVIGKPVGILLFCFLAVKLLKAKLPQNVRWVNLTGAAVLAGIGFTMSIFISNLAFSNPELISYSKVAVLMGSLIATVAGLTILLNTKQMEEAEE